MADQTGIGTKIRSSMRAAQREELLALLTKESLPERQSRPTGRHDGIRGNLDLAPGINLVGILRRPVDRIRLRGPEGDTGHFGPDGRRRTHRTRFESGDQERTGQVTRSEFPSGSPDDGHLRV